MNIGNANAIFFVAELIFLGCDNWHGTERALAAERELRAAGFETNITADVDPDSNAAWMVIARQSEVDLWKEVESIVKEFGGYADEGGVGPLDAFWRSRLEDPESERVD